MVSRQSIVPSLLLLVLVAGCGADPVATEPDPDPPQPTVPVDPPEEPTEPEGDPEPEEEPGDPAEPSEPPAEPDPPADPAEPSGPDEPSEPPAEPDPPAEPPPPVATAIEVTAGETVLTDGERTRLSAVVIDDHGDPMEGASVQWESSSGAIIIEGGWARAVSPGTAVITARHKGLKASLTIRSRASEERVYARRHSARAIRVHWHTPHGWLAVVVHDLPGEPWQLGRVFLDREGEPGQPGVRPDTIVASGAWEFAVQFPGEPDFVGNVHKHEPLREASTWKDGAPFSTEGRFFVGADEWRFDAHSSLTTMSRPNQSVAEVDRSLVFTRDGIAGDVRIEWLRNIEIHRAYAAMCPVARGPGVASRARLLGDDVVQDVSRPGFDPRRFPAHGAEWWNDQNDLRIRFEITNPGVALANYQDSGPLYSWIHNHQSYNKFYATRISNGGRAVTGEVWQTRFRFEVQ